MIDRDTARAIVASFSNQPGYPETREGLAVLIDAFERESDDRDHAWQIAEELRIENHFAPTVAGVHRIASATRKPKPERGCERCESGWLESRTEVDIRGVKQELSAVRRCPDCYPERTQLEGGEARPRKLIGAAGASGLEDAGHIAKRLLGGGGEIA